MARAEIHRYELLHVLKVSAGLQRRRSGGRRKKWPTRRPPRYVRVLGMVCVLWQWVAHRQFRTNPRAVSLKSQKQKKSVAVATPKLSVPASRASLWSSSSEEDASDDGSETEKVTPPPIYMGGTMCFSAVARY